MGASGRADRAAGLATAAAAGPAAAATAALARRMSRATLAPARAALRAAGGTAPVPPGTLRSRGISPVLGSSALPRREPATGSPGISAVPSGPISSSRRYLSCGTPDFSCPVRLRVLGRQILSVFVQLPIVGLAAVIHKCFTQVHFASQASRASGQEAAGTKRRAPPRRIGKGLVPHQRAAGGWSALHRPW
jgi:hypothetical protein